MTSAQLHMFDVDMATGGTWRESNAYTPGAALGVVDGTPVGRLGLAICYDINSGFNGCNNLIGRFNPKFGPERPSTEVCGFDTAKDAFTLR